MEFTPEKKDKSVIALPEPMPNMEPQENKVITVPEETHKAHHMVERTQEADEAFEAFEQGLKTSGQFSYAIFCRA